MSEFQLDVRTDRALKPLSRQAWIDATEFYALPSQEVLKQVTDRVSERENPLVLLDLDSTLYEVRPRTYFILKEWAQTEAAKNHPEVCALILSMGPHQIGYSIEDTFENLGLGSPGQIPSSRMDSLLEVQRFWKSRFFHSDYLSYDFAYDGAAEFVRGLHERGASIVYLTGRDEPQMGNGTRSNLIRDGFPWSLPKVSLMMKPHFKVGDLEFKQNALRFLELQGHLIASFENEPLNLLSIQKAFPSAMHVFMDTLCSDHPAPVGRGIYRITGFVDF
ncbi:MAG: HAD family hydrolase [Bdellovibrionia bacterium]